MLNENKKYIQLTINGGKSYYIKGMYVASKMPNRIPKDWSSKNQNFPVTIKGRMNEHVFMEGSTAAIEHFMLNNYTDAEEKQLTVSKEEVFLESFEQLGHSTVIFNERTTINTGFTIEGLNKYFDKVNVTHTILECGESLMVTHNDEKELELFLKEFYIPTEIKKPFDFKIWAMINKRR